MKLFALLFGKKYYAAHSFLIKYLLIAKGLSIGKNFYIEGMPKIKSSGKMPNIEIGDNVSIMGDIELKTREEGKIKVKNNVKIDNGCRLLAAQKGILSIAEGVKIGCYTIINSGGNTEIGLNTLISGFCYLQTSSHGKDKNSPIQLQPHEHKNIKIGLDCWIGSHVSILGGVNLSRGTIIGTKSVMIKNSKPFEIWAGVPAKKISHRKNKNKLTKLK
jgi:acetyltransferase-like isoleucine patch superfamily enzyme